MKRVSYLIASVVAVCLLAHAAEVKVYPGARIDEKATKEAREAAAAAEMSDVKATIYTTADPFQKVTWFYLNIAKEYAMPGASGTSGKPKKRGAYELWEAYFILDGARDLATSKAWVKVQRPYIASVSSEGKVRAEGPGVRSLKGIAGPVYEDIRDVTAIITSEKR